MTRKKVSKKLQLKKKIHFWKFMKILSKSTDIKKIQKFFISKGNIKFKRIWIIGKLIRILKK